VAALIGYALLNRHRFGNHLLLTGGNRDAAIAVGVQVRGVKITAFMLCAISAAFAGLLQATRINQIEPSYATISGIELKAIAAVVVGGTSLFGGRGAILGIVLGAVLIETVDNLLVLVSAPETIFKGFLGATTIVAVVINTVVGRRARR
jgi:simple sugar transport system permease protein